MSKESFWEKFILADFFSRNLDQGKSGTDIFEKYKRQLEEEGFFFFFEFDFFFFSSKIIQSS